MSFSSVVTFVQTTFITDPFTTDNFHNGSVMNVACYEHGLLWAWCNELLCYERGLLKTGLFWTDTISCIWITSYEPSSVRCRALYNLPWRASVSNHQVQCNIPTFEALLRKYTYLFLERCRKSNNIWLRALMQSDCLYSSLFFEHYNRILLCEWVIELCNVRLIDGVSSQNAFAFYLDSTNLGISALLRRSAVTSVTC